MTDATTRMIQLEFWKLSRELSQREQAMKQELAAKDELLRECLAYFEDAIKWSDDHMTYTEGVIASRIRRSLEGK